MTAARRFLALILLLCVVGSAFASRDKAADAKRRNKEGGSPYSLITKRQTQCEVEALAIGSALADNYNSLDEETEWDSRMHSDYLAEYLGFFGLITQGVWGKAGRTSEFRDANKLQKAGKWLRQKNLTESAYWALENQWIYMMGDSTHRQVWATLEAPSQGNDFERNSKEWTRENCRRQYPHRRRHPANGAFPDEGWYGKCGNNEVTCDLSGYGPRGKITFDWKHFPYEDYDAWLYGDTGPWGNYMELDDSHSHEVIQGPQGSGDNAQNLVGGERLRRTLRGAEADVSVSHAPGTHTLAAAATAPLRAMKLSDPHLDWSALLEGREQDHNHDHDHDHDHDHHDHARQLKGDTDSEIFEGTFQTRLKNTTDEKRRPDVFVFEVGLHTCFHAYNNNNGYLNETYVLQHEKDLKVLFRAITAAITRPTAENTTYPGPETIVIVSAAGRIGVGTFALDQCTWKFNRRLADEAHRAGFAFFEREEIERRLLFKSDSYLGDHKGKYIKPNMHLPAPSPQIVATSLLAMISCLRSARSDNRNQFPYHEIDHGNTVPIHASPDDDPGGQSFV
jgi:hypothetical protein